MYGTSRRFTTKPGVSLQATGTLPTLSILQGWVKAHPNEPAFQIPKALEAKVKAGKLGRKSGEGFYKWEGDKKQ